MASNSQDPDDPPPAPNGPSQSEEETSQVGDKSKEFAIGVRVNQAFNCMASVVYSHNYFWKNDE
mgnify:FL=1